MSGEQETPLNHHNLKDHLQCDIPSLQAGLLQDHSSHRRAHQGSIIEKDEASQSPSPGGITRCSHLYFSSKINWKSTVNACRQWLKHPMNIALVVWLAFVCTFLLFFCLLITGLLNSALQTKTLRDEWIEICNQVLNALFTLMVLYQHPYLFHHFVLLCRWRSEDITALRKIYCKNGTHKPKERTHMAVVLILFHITCISQYALCPLYWAYNSENRPELPVDAFFILGVVTSVVGGLHMVFSPLGREYDLECDDEESQTRASNNSSMKASHNSLKLCDRRFLVSQPQWIGGLFECQGDTTVAYQSFFCTFCVFGWNMERLGFGNMYVHIVTFLLLCVAPILVFSLTALHINNDVVRNTVAITGVVLCLFGLLYGGYWRIQIRKRFELPGKAMCCSSKSMTDYMQWMFCGPCSLAQEIRTGNFYDVKDNRLYRKCVESEIDCLIRDSPGHSRAEEEQSDSSAIIADYSDETMSAPVQQLID